MRRKCAILRDYRNINVPLEKSTGRSGRDRFDNTAQFEHFKAALEANGVEITGSMQGQGYVFGWVDSDQISTVRALPEVAVINDDYPYLVQEDLAPQPETSGQEHDGSLRSPSDEQQKTVAPQTGP